MSDIYKKGNERRQILAFFCERYVAIYKNSSYNDGTSSFLSTSKWWSKEHRLNTRKMNMMTTSSQQSMAVAVVGALSHLRFLQKQLDSVSVHNAVILDVVRNERSDQFCSPDIMLRMRSIPDVLHQFEYTLNEQSTA